ncbi:MAG: HPP family protein [Desulfosudis oleivorans]|nr:HPP family protein [Desulfosudis oleivorans]
MLGEREAVLLIVGSMGASAVLLFAVPHGPLSQPWAADRRARGLGADRRGLRPLGAECRCWRRRWRSAWRSAPCTTCAASHPPGGAHRR